MANSEIGKSFIPGKNRLSRDVIDEFVKDYGFTLWSTERAGNSVEYHYMESLYGINLWVNSDTKDFRMEWIIPHSTFTVKCPTCSPITSEEHFVKMLRKFKRAVRCLFYEELYS